VAGYKKICIIPSGLLRNSPFLSVQKLNLDGHGSHRSVLSDVASRFPNLRKVENLAIHLNLKESELDLIFTSWPKMEDMQLDIMLEDDPLDWETWKKKNINLVFSGIPEGSEAALSQLAENVGWTAVASLFDHSRPSFRDMKRKYHISYFIYSPWLFISNESLPAM